MIFGASGDLAVKKTYPALFSLYCNGGLPSNFKIIGTGRTFYQDGEFKAKISSKFLLHGDTERAKVGAFLDRCIYYSLDLFAQASYLTLNNAASEPNSPNNRLFYLALPPSLYIHVSEQVKTFIYAREGLNVIIVEKPFGKDSDSYAELSASLATNWKENEVF
jgi:glucose-6-phosphate 1-dehydrogenase